MRLNRKTWVMVVLSVIWVIGAGVYTRKGDVDRAESFAKAAYKVCTDGKNLHHETDLSSCDAERAKSIETWMQGSDANVAFTALVPVPFAWLGAFILLYIVRAQFIGFRALVPWSTLSRLKKSFVAVCVLSVGAAIVLGIVVLLNVYTDRQVPVGLSPFLDVTSTGELVTVAGTWTRTDLTNGTIASPLQTSKIECNKQENRCTEAVASVSGTVLMADVVDYDIQSWTRDAIVLQREYPCAVELFTIDLNTKAVTGAGHRTHNDWALCKLDETNGKTEWSFQLSNGFNVYWGLRQKARPLALRIVQSVFGN
jgi:hypothetical protein